MTAVLTSLKERAHHECKENCGSGKTHQKNEYQARITVAEHSHAVYLQNNNRCEGSMMYP